MVSVASWLPFDVGRNVTDTVLLEFTARLKDVMSVLVIPSYMSTVKMHLV